VLRAATLVLLLTVICASTIGCSKTSRSGSHNSNSVVLRATSVTSAGTSGHGSTAELNALDSDSDGIPDSAELRSFEDRRSFRAWFTAIAEMQFYQPSDEWNRDQRDCAGLVRFSMREALRRHDRPWFKRLGATYEQIAPDVKALTIDEPPLRERLFRTDFGSFAPSDLNDGHFSEFADARTIKSHNSTLVSRDRRQAQPGDLLFFHDPRNPRFPYHVMIFIGEARYAADGASDWVVYHTGSSATDNGTMKKVRLAVLDHHPDARWRPIESNQNFLGFYRLNILD
jgi:hypothetical protein